MNIKGIGPNNIVNAYGKNQSRIESTGTEPIKDSIEISSLGKSLSSLDLDNPSVDNSKKLERIKKEIEAGTYNVDAKLTAQKILDIMKGRGI